MVHGFCCWEVEAHSKKLQAEGSKGRGRKIEAQGSKLKARRRRSPPRAGYS